MANKTIYLSSSSHMSPGKINFYLVFGVFLILFSGYQLHLHLHQVPYYELTIEIIKAFRFWNTLLLFVIGVGILLFGLQWVGKKTPQYIWFGKDKIVYKPSYLKSTRSIDIENIKEFIISPTWILCVSDKEKLMIDLSWVAPHIAIKIKEKLKNISNTKQITVKDQERKR